jgi:hypothetical protein
VRRPHEDKRSTEAVALPEPPQAAAHSDSLDASAAVDQP